MSAYVAAPSEQWSLAAHVITALRVRGVECSYNWPRQVRADREAGRTDADLTPDQATKIDAACVAGVRRSSVLVWISDGSIGAAVEAGVARGLGIPVVIVGTPHPIFGRGAVAVFDSVDDAVIEAARIDRIARARVEGWG